MLTKESVIIGNGMVASACRTLKGWDDDILFASGVSNSRETNQNLFQKEIEMIERSLESVKGVGSFVYFSTTSISDPARQNSPYILHKLQIEDMIRNSNVRHLIVRLPNLVGQSSNPHTLTNFFANSIREGRRLTIMQNAIRHVIDADDLVKILEGINRQYGKTNTTVNVETTRPLKASEILQMMEDALNRKAQYVEANEKIAGNSSSVDKYSAIKYIFETGADYHPKLFRKYYAG